jgi:hypothetical protein
MFSPSSNCSTRNLRSTGISKYHFHLIHKGIGLVHSSGAQKWLGLIGDNRAQYQTGVREKQRRSWARTRFDIVDKCTQPRALK